MMKGGVGEPAPPFLELVDIRMLPFMLSGAPFAYQGFKEERRGAIIKKWEKGFFG